MDQSTQRATDSVNRRPPAHAFTLFWVFALTPLCPGAPAPTPPPDWRMELVAQAPEVRHPSVVCVAPDGRVFVAEDPMDISTAHADAKEGRIICVHPDGRRTVFAEKLHAVFGMQYLEGKLYVLHNPHFSVFTDDNGVGKDRTELIESLNPNPWALDWNDHVPANFRLAMDGYFYVAVGDKGIFGAVGRDGKRVDMRGGGVLRLRPDGTELEVYCTGVRNILEVALNNEDEIFTYDNTDEHDWMGRLTHMVDGGSYGYPYDFVPRRPYTLWMMHDFGGGAATGALCYNEDALPDEYHGNLFLGDFGKQQILRVRIARAGATYRVATHEEFFKNQPADFRPVGIAFGADGASLYICDWQHRDTKENVVVGRLWKATYTGASRAKPKPAWYLAAAMGQPSEATKKDLIASLGHPSKNVRLAAQRELARRRESRLLVELVRDTSAAACSRWHAIWALDAIDGGKSGRGAILAAVVDHDASVRRQAIRQLGNRRVREAAPTVITRLKDDDAGVRFQAAAALGRIADPAAVPALMAALGEKDIFARHAVFTALNRIGRANRTAWAEIAKGLESDRPAVREGTEFALRTTYDAVLLDVLIALAGEPQRDLATRETALRLVSELHHKLPEWNGEWWAYHPALGASPEKNEVWAGTPKIVASLRAVLDDAESRVRLLAVNGLRAAGNADSSPQLRRCLERETASEVRRAIIAALGQFKDAMFAPALVHLLREAKPETATLSEAVRAAGQIGGDELKSALLDLSASTAVDVSVRVEAIGVLGQLKARDVLVRLEPLLKDDDRSVRVATIKAIAQIGGDEALRMLRPLLTSGSSELRREAVTAVGSLHDRNAVLDLLAAWRSPETRPEALNALAQISDVRAVDAYLEGLGSPNSALREQCRKALGGIRDEALPLIEQRAPSLNAGTLGELRRIYKGHSRAERGALFARQVATPELEDYERHALEHCGDPVRGQRVFFDESGVACVKCHALAGHGGPIGPDLTLVGAQFPRRDLIEHVLYPSRVVREGYQQIIIETRDGDSFSGLMKGETAEAVMLLDAKGELQTVPKNTITSRTASSLSLMPEGLQFGLSLDQFSDLIAFLESRREDPGQAAGDAAPEGFSTLFNGRDLAGWRELPEGTRRVQGTGRYASGSPRAGHSGTAARESRLPQHWQTSNGALEHDGKAGDLWTEREFGDFVLRLDWRWADVPVWENFPLISQDGNEEIGADGKQVTERVLDGGDSGVLLRGLYKAQANLFCYPVGSGEVWEYRTDPAVSSEQRRALTPRKRADRPVGDWNRMEITLRGDRLTVVLNGEEVIASAQLPGVPVRGPIGLQHEHGRIQFRNIFVREL